MVSQFLSEWMKRDPDTAINTLLSEPKLNVDNLNSLLDDIADLMPGRLAEVLGKMPKSEDRWSTSAQTAFGVFAAKDLEGARAAAESLTGPWRAQALAGVAKAWGEKDGAAALAWAHALPPGEARDSALKATLTGWAKVDPLGALAKLDQAPPGGQEMYYGSDTASQVLGEASKKDWNATMEWLRQNPGKVGPNSLEGLQSSFTRRLKADPSGTMREILEGGVAGLDNVFGNSILNDGYAQHDAVWSWLQGQPKNEKTDRLRASLINAMTYKEPEAAMEFLGKFPNTPENKQLFDNAAQSLINGGSRSANLEKLLEKAPDALRPGLLEYGLMYGREAVGADAEKWVKRLDELPKEKRENAVSGLARGWAANDPEAAFQWAMKLPDDRERDQAFSSVASIWANNDPDEFAAMVESLPEGANRERGNEKLAYALAGEHPSEAWSWALEIKDEGRRLSVMQNVYSQAFFKNPAAADELAQSANLSPEQIKIFRQQAEAHKNLGGVRRAFAGDNLIYSH
jgi:hypothetical protein